MTSEERTGSTRERMVAGAMDLMRRRGVTATSFREVVRHTDTPRGSIGHHFPGGKQQLIEEALHFAGEQVGGPLQHALRSKGAVAGLRSFIQWWARLLEANAYEVGCPVLAVAVEPYVGDRPDAEADRAGQQQILDVAQEVFSAWQSILAAQLRSEGVPAARAKRLSTFCIATMEGAIALCRVARSGQPLEQIRLELELMLQAAIG